MTGERRRFSVTAPDWGQDHLSSDAIVAYVDSELAARPHSRATAHLAECPDCAMQVTAQGQARSALRSARCPSLPSSLLSSLRSIPQDAELPGPPTGLAMTADGQLVTVVRAELTPSGPVERERPPIPRRLKFGAGAAVSGLALGALALGLPGVASGPPPTTADRGVFNGSVVGGTGVVDARLRLTPVNRQSSVTDRMDRIPGSFIGLR